ncbi:hypothetical protein [Prevotella sp. HUN102]|uniref:hypothetical protein n=1 Tax=Prevotella sp. HUN102 TaxID=1392486 RepID=UPI000A79ECFD|nr:hypothetical protein [Prevotella sp. HUN102]
MNKKNHLLYIFIAFILIFGALCLGYQYGKSCAIRDNQKAATGNDTVLIVP